MNRNAVLYLLICPLLSLGISACSRQADENAKMMLAQAEAMMYTAPDSALRILEELRPPKGREQRATWALLLVQARYKNNEKQSDSLVNVAYDYFEKTDDAERKALALYLKGGIAGENGEELQEQDLYLQAKAEVEKTNDERLFFLIESNLCNLYAYRGMKDYALQAIERAVRYAERLNDPEYLISAYLFLGRVHNLKPADNDKSIYYYRQAIAMAKEFHNKRKLELATWELVGMYSSIRNYEQALQLVQESKALYDEEGNIPLNALYILAELYRKLGRVDSAYYYINKGLVSTASPRVKRGAYYLLYQLKWEQGLYKEAAQACERSLIYNDSVIRSEKAQEMIEMQAKYDQQKAILERNELQMEKDRVVRNFLLTLVAAIFVIAFLIGMYQRLLIKKERALKAKEEVVRENAQKIAENEMVMLRNKQRMAELMQQIEAEGALKEQLQEQTEAFEKIKQQNNELALENKRLEDEQHQYLQVLERHTHELEELNKLTAQNKYLHERERLLTDNLVYRSALLNKVKTRHPYIKDEEWRKLKEELDLIFDDYTHRLQKMVPALSEGEMRLACLIKLQMTNKDMSESLGISPPSVGKSKMRLKDRLAHAVPSFDRNMLVDLWLWDF